MRTKRLGLILIMFIYLSSEATIAQKKKIDLNAKQKAELSNDRLFDPSQTSTASLGTSQLTFEGTKDDATAKARIGWQYRDLASEIRGSVPIAKDDNQKDIADLDGLARKATVDFGATWVSWHPSFKEGADEEQLCIKMLVETGRYSDDNTARAAIHNREFVCAISTMPAGSLYRKSMSQTVDWGHPILVSTRYRFTNEQFKYALPPNFSDQNDSHVSYSATANVGLLPLFPVLGLIQLGYQYQSSYEGQDSSNVCTPIANSTSTTCRDIATATPQRSVKSILQLETREFLGTHIGLAPVISGDLRSKDASIAVPVYFFKSKEGGLNGGITLKWKSDKNTFAASVFIGDVLTLLSKD